MKNTIPKIKKIFNHEYEEVDLTNLDATFVIDDQRLSELLQNSQNKKNGQDQYDDITKSENPRSANSSRNLGTNDETCPDTELWVRYMTYTPSGTTISKIYIWDHEIRSTDQGQVLAGTFYEDVSNSLRHCFLAKLNRKGTLITSAYMNNFYASSVTERYYSECYAVELTSYNEVIAVGLYISDSGGYRALIIKNEYYDGESSSSELLSHSIIRLWSGGYDTIAYDVDTTMDGGIYVTGSVTKWVHDSSSTGYDCFVLRLNHTLDKVFVKSFGGSQNEYCKSIQVTRNNDYIYLGGQRLQSDGVQQLMFFKLDGYGDSFVYTRSITPTSSSEDFSLRRIILEQGNSFSGSDDQNELYFCGSTTANNGDFIFGKLSTSFGVTRIYRYGSPGDEVVGDCALTSDNGYFIGGFSSSQYIERTFTEPTITYTTSDYIVTADPFTQCKKDSTNNGNGVGGQDIDDMDIQGINHEVGCDYDDNIIEQDLYQISKIICSTSELTSRANTCKNGVVDGFEDMFDNYANMYSWTTCDFYVLDFTNAECNGGTVSIDYLDDCDPDISTGYVEECQGGTCDYFLCSTITDYYDLDSYVLFTGGNYGFRSTVWNLFDTDLTNEYIDYTFCDQSGSGNSYDDYFYFVLEQDCTDDAKAPSLTYDWFIFRVNVDDMDSNTLTNIPETAGYFGDRDGDEMLTSINVDDYGYITISGTTTSECFGGTSGTTKYSYNWLYAKTHWHIQYELNVLSGTWTADTDAPFINKRFIEPKHYKNDGTYTFLYDYSSSTSYSTFSSFEIPYPILEDISYLPYKENVGTLYQYIDDWYGDYSVSATLFGESWYSMNNQYEYKVYQDIPFSISAPYICTLSDDGKYYTYRKYNIDTASIGGLSSDSQLDDSAVATIGGTITASEGVYYPTVWGLGDTDSIDSTDYTCPENDYWYNQNADDTAALLRFQIQIRMKLIVDDVYTKPPEVETNFPDLTLLVGQRYNSADLRDYFQQDCTYYYARRSPLDSSNTYRSTMLPYWMQFYEINGTFTMYPPGQTVDNSYQIEVVACNSIYECATLTFTVTIYDTSPTLDSSFPDFYIIQYDTAEDIGQHFTWSQTATYFSDDDQISDSSNDPYDHQSHTVWVTQTSTNTAFDSVYWMGLIFGQGIGPTTNNFGSNTITFKYQDLYSENSVLTSSFTVYINRKPEITTTGSSYTFSDLDPTDVTYSTYFDNILPVVVDDFEDDLLVVVDMSTWFTDDDGDSLSYQLTYSDGTDAPGWIGFDEGAGEFRGFPQLDDSSELIQMKITAYDTYGGVNYLYKSLLVNSYPVAQPGYDIITIAVGRKSAINIGSYFSDADRDFMNISIPSSSDETTLERYNLEFGAATKVLEGIPTQAGTMAQIAFKASDVHGYSDTLYLTIKVKNMKPDQRMKIGLPDKYIYAAQRYIFALDNAFFYDPWDATPIVLFASNPYDEKLPSWIKFIPSSRTFFGIAPDTQVQISVKVQVRAMNRQSHESVTNEFNIIVLPNNNPKTNVEAINQDVEVSQGSWLQQQISVQVFDDYENNTNASIHIQGSSGVKLPEWINYNDLNRTIYGYAGELGVYRIDVVYTDDYGAKTYFNFKLTVKQKPSPGPLFKIVWLLFALSLVGMIIWFVYLYHLSYALKPIEKDKQTKKISNKRFGAFRDVQVDYYEHRDYDGTYIQTRYEAVRTFNQKFHYTTAGKLEYDFD